MGSGELIPPLFRTVFMGGWGLGAGGWGLGAGGKGVTPIQEGTGVINAMQ